MTIIIHDARQERKELGYELLRIMENEAPKQDTKRRDINTISNLGVV